MDYHLGLPNTLQKVVLWLSSNFTTVLHVYQVVAKSLKNYLPGIFFLHSLLVKIQWMENFCDVISFPAVVINIHSHLHSQQWILLALIIIFSALAMYTPTVFFNSQSTTFSFPDQSNQGWICCRRYMLEALKRDGCHPLRVWKGRSDQKLRWISE